DSRNIIPIDNVNRREVECVRNSTRELLMMGTTTIDRPAPSWVRRSPMTTGMTLIWVIALAKFLFHLYFNNRYGYFRDEFDYMSCGDHLAWGYVDQPPLIPFLIQISRAVLGDSLRAI